MDRPGRDIRKRTIRLEWILTRLDRAAAWVSAIVLVLYIVSGYGMTRVGETQALTAGLMTPDRAYALHNGLFIPLLVTFGFHTSMGLRRALVRTTRGKLFASWAAAGIGAVALSYLLLLGV